jgi:DNA-binding transcriptional ArsR family regulator
MLIEPSEAALEALADSTRRAIVAKLRQRPLPVGVIARDLPVSRPAVSSHLRILSDAGLVTHRGVGTRNVYALRPEGFADLRRWLDSLWGDALTAFAAYVDRIEEGEKTP